MRKEWVAKAKGLTTQCGNKVKQKKWSLETTLINGAYSEKPNE